MKRLTMLIVVAACAAHAADEAAPTPLPAPMPAMGLSREQIQKHITAASPEFKHCRDVELVKHRDPVGRVIFRIIISGDGTVARVWAHESTFEERDLELCIQDVLQSVRFPPPIGGRVVKVTYPFIFTNGIKQLTVQGPRNRAEVDRTMQSSALAFEACMVERPSPSSKGTALMMFAIGADGVTRRVFVAQSTLDSFDADDCLVQEVKALRFPPLDGNAETRVVYPLRFLSPDAKPPASTPARKTGSCGWPF